MHVELSFQIIKMCYCCSSDIFVSIGAYSCFDLHIYPINVSSIEV